MVGYYYKTGKEIHEIICFMEEKLKLSCVASPGSLKTGQTYGWKPYRFSFFLNERKEIVYLIEPLAGDETDYEQLGKRCQSKEEKPMTIYDYTNSRPDYVSNPLTAINVMIMISSLKERFGDKLHETARKGYLTMLDVNPCKYYKLYLWYWSDSCCYGIRECTEEDFNIKEEKKMTNMSKEEALKKIEELKAFVEKLDEEIPEMITSTNSKETAFLGSYEYGALNEYHRITFNDETDKRYYLIKAFELAHLMYAREHLGFKTKYFCKYRLYFDSDKLEYDVIEFDRYNNYSSDGVFESINHWLFPDEDSARKVANYMNKYVKDKVKELY